MFFGDDLWLLRLTVEVISKQARLQLDQALESAHLPWGQFEVLLSNLG